MANPQTQPLSGYAKFHMKYIGYNFYDHNLKRIMPKYVLWATKQELCKTMMRNDKTISRYSLVGRMGWFNGNKQNYETNKK